jgi:hypothetical protein
MCSLDHVTPNPSPPPQHARQQHTHFPMPPNAFLSNALQANPFLPPNNNNADNLPVNFPSPFASPLLFPQRASSDVTRIDLNNSKKNAAPKNAFADARMIQLACCGLFLAYALIGGYACDFILYSFLSSHLLDRTTTLLHCLCWAILRPHSLSLIFHHPKAMSIVGWR